MADAVLDLTPRARRRLVSRARILEAAARAVADYGIDGLSMNQLARQVGFTPGALYRYFDSKDALIAALAVDVLAELRSMLEEGVTLAPSSRPLRRVLLLVDVYRRYSVVRAHHFGFLSILFGDPRILVANDDEARKVMLAIERTLAPLLAALDAAARERHLAAGDARARTLQLFAAVQGVLQLRKQARVAGDRFDVDGLVDELLEALLVGWGAAVARVRRGRRDNRVLEPLERHMGGLV